MEGTVSYRIRCTYSRTSPIAELLSMLMNFVLRCQGLRVEGGRQERTIYPLMSVPLRSISEHMELLCLAIELLKFLDFPPEGPSIKLVVTDDP